MTHEELLIKAKEAKTAEELLALAKENGIEMTEESAKAYFEQIHKTGELADEELDNVSGGGCYFRDGRLIVTVWNECEYWTCKRCGKGEDSFNPVHYCRENDQTAWKIRCDNCQYCSYEQGFWLCNHRKNKA